jgi:hypothetical protein
MTTATTLRRRAGQRISAAVWGLLVMGSGALMIAALSGYDIDLQLIAIIVLTAIGGWMLLSAAVSGLGRRKEIARATAPTVEEPAQPTDPTDPEDPADPEAALSHPNEATDVLDSDPVESDEATDVQERDKD